MTSIRVLEPGWATTLQDLGRPGLAHLGVSPAGAVDPGLARLVNRLVGNPEHAAVIETAGGLRFSADGPIVVASSVELAPVSLSADEPMIIDTGGPRAWSYVAVRGGIDVAPVLGSRSTDTMSGLGPPVPEPGSLWHVGNETAAPIVADVAPRRARLDSIRCRLGPRDDWFDVHAVEQLVGEEWTVSVASRVGVRFDGPMLGRRRAGELPSEGLVRGALQVPPDGRPVMMLADHPTTGGYPVLAVVDPADVAEVAQRPTGTIVRFRVEG